MLDLFGTIVITVAIVLNVNAVLGAAPVAPAQRLTVAGIAGAWIGLSAALAAAGELADSTARALPLIGALVAGPLVAAGTAAAASPAVRTAMLGIPTALLVGLNVSRVFGVFFLLLEGAGRLGGPFPTYAGWGDILAGVLAIPMAVVAARADARWLWMVAAWNLYAAADLVLAIFLGITSAGGSPVQLFAAGAGSSAMQVLPWSLVPTVLVPFYLIGHAIVFAQLWRRMPVRDIGSLAPARPQG